MSDTVVREKRGARRSKVLLDADAFVLGSLHHREKVTGFDGCTRQRSRTMDISMSGIRMKMLPFGHGSLHLTPADMLELSGGWVKVDFDGLDINIQARVVRVYAETREICLNIRDVSDIQAWKGVCNQVSGCAGFTVGDRKRFFPDNTGIFPF